LSLLFVFFFSLPFAALRRSALPVPFFCSTEIPLASSLDDERGPAKLRRPATAGAASGGNVTAAQPIRPASAAAGGPSDPALGDQSRAAASAPPAAAGVKGHWNATIAELTADVARALSDFDAPLWEKSMRQAKEQVQAARRQAEAEGRALPAAGDKLVAAVKAVSSATATTQQPRGAWTAK
jgi:hypothetical protein